MKNLKGFLTNTIAILAGILILVFLSQPYFNYIVDSILGSGSVEGISGYSIIGNYFESEDAKAVVLALSCLIVAILAGVLILFGIFNLLTSTRVVKVRNPRIMNKVNFFVAILLVIVGVIGFGCAIGISKDTSFDTAIGGVQLINGTYNISWAHIVNLTLSFVALVSTFVACVGRGKKTKKNKKK